MTEDEVTETAASDMDESVPEEEEVMVTVWSPEPTEKIELNNTPIDEWVRNVLQINRCPNTGEIG